MRIPQLHDVFPDVATATAPIKATIGTTGTEVTSPTAPPAHQPFETVSLPAQAAHQLLDLLGHLDPHPIGAALADEQEWVLIVPPGSGELLHWPWPTLHRNRGVLWVPPLSAGPDRDSHWIRRGNGEGRAFTAPFPVHAVVSLIQSLEPLSPAELAHTPVRN
ncbi:hypothetical protein [Streptomyces griseus]|uniref:hypothetical protein n=1 Tax=Streptomyces griseus TaxID=1911 RepID=UPI00379A54A0